MHTFSSFSPLFEETVNSCRSICDQLMVFDGEGSVLAVRTSDPSLRAVSDFFSLLEGGEQDFFLAHGVDFECDRLAIMTRYGAALVFTHLFPTCGIFVALLVDVEPALLGRLTGVAASRAIRLASTESGAAENFTVLTETLRIATEALCFYGERDSFAFDPAQVLMRRVCAVARFVGCYVSCRCEAISTFSDAFVFSLPAFTSILLLLLMQARREAFDRAASVSLTLRDDRIFVELSAESEGETSVLTICRGIAERKELLFEVRREGTREIVTFSPTVCDVSYLGLKNPFLFE